MAPGQSAQAAPRHGAARQWTIRDQRADAAAVNLKPEVVDLLRKLPAFGRCLLAVSSGSICSALSSLSLALPLAFGVRRQGAQQLFKGTLTQVGGTAPIVIVSAACCTLHVDCRAIRSMDLQVSQRGRSRSECIVLRDSQATVLGWIEPVGNPDVWEIFIGLAGCRRMANDAGVLQTRSSIWRRQGNANRLDMQLTAATGTSALGPSRCCNP